MIKLRKLKKHEKKDFPKAVAVISIGKEAPYEGILTQEDINELHKQVKLFAIPVVSNSALPTLKDFAINTFKAIGKQNERLTSGNVSHQGMTIRGSANRAAEFIEKHYC